MRLIYKDDINGQEGLFSEDGFHQIMMEWEKEYMYACIDKLNPTGDVLEIGFGMGYSADKIQSFNVKSHTIIECNPVVLEKLEEYKKDHPNVIIVKGRWQDVLETCGKFDSIFFDDYVLDGTLDFSRLSKFCIEVLKNHTNINSKISYYSTTDKNPFENSENIIKYECDNYNVKIPEHCNYAKGDKMYIPLITKINNDTNKLNYSLPKIELSSLKAIMQPPENAKPCYSNYIVINNFYNNIDKTRDYVLSILLKEDKNTSTMTSFTENHKEHIEKFLPFNIKIKDYENTENGKYILENENIDKNNLTVNLEYDWIGILFMTPNSDINNGIDIFDEKGNLTDVIGNIYNRLVLIPKNITYIDKRFYNSDKNKNSLKQYFCFNSK